MKAEKFITKDMHVWPKKIIQVYNKVRRNYCKLWQLSLLQSAVIITNCDSTMFDNEEMIIAVKAIYAIA